MVIFAFPVSNGKAYSLFHLQSVMSALLSNVRMKLAPSGWHIDACVSNTPAFP